MRKIYGVYMTNIMNLWAKIPQSKLHTTTTIIVLTILAFTLHIRDATI